MKKIIAYSSLLFLCGIFAACTKTTEIYQPAPAPVGTLQLSTEKIVFDIDGGISAILVSAPADWDYTADGDWFTVTRTDNTLQVSVGANGTPDVLTGSITVTIPAGDEETEPVSQVVSLTQRTTRSVNLSVDGTANCYVAPTNGEYKFDATVKGNGGSDGGKSTYIQKYGVAITDVAYVSLLWEARPDGDKSLSREIIDGAPTYGDGYISFATGRSEGNALIGAYDMNGTLLWSWHIWVTDTPITSHAHANKDGALGQIMDRNLGAMNNTPMDIGNRGMFYQWGRKDPFLPSISPYIPNVIATTPNDPANNVGNYEVGNGMGVWNYTEQAPIATEVPGNVPYTIQNPMTFLAPYGGSYEWYCQDDSQDAVLDSKLWDTQKTIFDPCPAGYKVPGAGTFGDAAGNQSITNGGTPAEYDENGENAKYDWNVWKDDGRTWQYTGDFYPAAGTLSFDTGGAPSKVTNTSIYGFYWTTENYSGASSAYSYRAEFVTNWAHLYGGAVVFTAQIRCVKE